MECQGQHLNSFREVNSISYSLNRVMVFDLEQLNI